RGDAGSAQRRGPVARAVAVRQQSGAGLPVDHGGPRLRADHAVGRADLVAAAAQQGLDLLAVVLVERRVPGPGGGEAADAEDAVGEVADRERVAVGIVVAL